MAFGGDLRAANVAGQTWRMNILTIAATGKILQTRLQFRDSLMIADASELAPGAAVSADICVIGSGAARPYARA